MQIQQIRNQLGFWSVAADVLNVVTPLVTAGAGAYTAIATVDLAKDQLKANQKLAEQKASLEADLIATQKRIYDIQAEGLSSRNEIDLRIAQAQAESLEKQLNRADELAQLESELSKIGIATDYQYAIMELEKAKGEFRTEQELTSAPVQKNIVSQMQKTEEVQFPLATKIAMAVGSGIIIWVLLRK